MVARAVVVRKERVRSPPSTLEMEIDIVKGFKNFTGEGSIYKGKG